MTKPPSTISHDQVMLALGILGIDPTNAQEIHIGHAGGIGYLTLVHDALDEQGRRHLDSNVPNTLARAATTYRFGDESVKGSGL